MSGHCVCEHCDDGPCALCACQAQVAVLREALQAIHDRALMGSGLSANVIAARAGDGLRNSEAIARAYEERIRAEEREANAKVLDAMAEGWHAANPGQALRNGADAIRFLGKK